MLAGFAGSAFAQTFTFDGQGGSITGAYPDFSITGSDAGGGNTTASYLATAPVDGTVTFSWTYDSSDRDGPSEDPAGYVVGGARTQFTDDFGADNQSGATSFNVTAGQTFGWYVNPLDSALGAATLHISASATFGSNAGNASQVAENFVTTRQRVIADAIQLPDILDRGTTGASVQTDDAGGVSGLAFAASTSEAWTPGSAADVLSRGPLAVKSDGKADDKPYSFWIDGKLGLHAGSDSSKFATAMAGADMLVEDGRALLGLSVEGDWMTTPTATSSTSGLGFLAGPYVSVALNEHLALDANLMIGRSWNSVSLTQSGSTYAGNFTTDRAQAGVRLKGKVDYDAATVSPDVSLFAIGENASGYTVTGPAGSIPLPGFFKYTLEASVGSDFEYRLDAGNGVSFVPKAGLHIGLGADSDSLYRFATAMVGIGVITESGVHADVSAMARITDSGVIALSGRATLGSSF